MRILHVTREFAADRRFGIGRSLQPVLDAFGRRGHEVRLLTQEDLGPRAKAAQARLSRVLTPPARLLYGDAGAVMASIWSERCTMGHLAARMARSWRADAVNLHDPWIGWGYRLACRFGPRPAGRWGISQHGFGAYADATREESVPSTPRLLGRLRRLEAGVLRNADWVLCPTVAARAQLARDLVEVAPARHWHVIPHARPLLGSASRTSVRQQLGLADDMPHVVAIGRVNPVKRLDAIVQACIALHRPLRLTLLAGGDGQALRALADSAPLLQFDLRTVDDVTPYLAAADVYVSAARNESFGLANLEALAAGVPALCTAVGGVPEVTAGRAWLLPGGDGGLVEAITQALQRLLDDPPLAAALADAGRRHAAAWPDADAVALRLEAIYQGG